ncbi:unnamed protein product, partial [marine sediment metagenome]
AANYRVANWLGTINDSSTDNINMVVIGPDRYVAVEFELPNTYEVGHDGDFSNIQEAVNFAKDGDIIIVDGGTWQGTEIRINKSITLTSKTPDDPSATVLDFTGYPHRAFILGPQTDSGTIIDGFTIQNSHWATPSWAPPPTCSTDGADTEPTEGGSIWIYGRASPVIKNCVIQNNSIRPGRGGDGTDACSNTCLNAGRGGWGGWAQGGGVYCGPYSSPAFINCQIKDNAVYGGSGGNGGSQT